LANAIFDIVVQKASASAVLPTGVPELEQAATRTAT